VIPRSSLQIIAHHLASLQSFKTAISLTCAGRRVPFNPLSDLRLHLRSHKTHASIPSRLPIPATQAQAPSNPPHSFPCHLLCKHLNITSPQPDPFPNPKSKLPTPCPAPQTPAVSLSRAYAPLATIILYRAHRQDLSSPWKQRSDCAIRNVSAVYALLRWACV